MFFLSHLHKPLFIVNSVLNSRNTRNTMILQGNTLQTEENTFISYGVALLSDSREQWIGHRAHTDDGCIKFCGECAEAFEI